MAYSCRVLADSVSPAGHRLTTFEVTFPRIVLAELNTHRMLVKSSASSRAIPVERRAQDVASDPFIPEEFGRNQKGMQPGTSLDGEAAARAKDIWVGLCVQAIAGATDLAAIEVHKQYANRVLEPFAWHTAVVTGTDWDNFFHLRVNPHAQGELRKAAELMQTMMQKSEPHACGVDSWHTPYLEEWEAIKLQTAGVDIVKVSVARCARVSYLNQRGLRSVEDDLALYDRLLAPGHMAPLEHVARPMTANELAISCAYDVAVDGGPVLRTNTWLSATPRVGQRFHGHGPEVTFVRGPLHYAGPFNGWISHRRYIPGEHDILGHRASAV